MNPQWFMSCRDFRYLYLENSDELDLDITLGHAGVGFLMEGVPENNAQLIHFLEEHSCPPIMARQICDDLNTQGYRVTTLQRSLRFDVIEKQLNSVGIKCKIVRPNNGQQTKQMEKIKAATEAFNFLKYHEESHENLNFFSDYLELGKKLLKKYGSTVHPLWERKTLG